jgi:hypothetical protein
MAHDSEGLWVAVVWIGILVLVLVFASSPVWMTKAWYSFTTAADYDHVIVSKKPIDCDWGAAPLGNKGCSYAKTVSTHTCAISTTGKPIWSDDGGKTWNLVEEGSRCIPETYVGWEKKEE